MPRISSAVAYTTCNAFLNSPPESCGRSKQIMNMNCKVSNVTLQKYQAINWKNGERNWTKFLNPTDVVKYCSKSSCRIHHLVRTTPNLISQIFTLFAVLVLVADGGVV